MDEKERCKWDVSSGGQFGIFYPRKCHNKVWKNGYCKVHQPESVEKRIRERETRQEKKYKNDPLTRYFTMVFQLRLLIKALKKKEDMGICESPKKTATKLERIIKGD